KWHLKRFLKRFWAIGYPSEQHRDAARVRRGNHAPAQDVGSELHSSTLPRLVSRVRTPSPAPDFFKEIKQIAPPRRIENGDNALRSDPQGVPRERPIVGYCRLARQSQWHLKGI